MLRSLVGSEMCIRDSPNSLNYSVVRRANRRPHLQKHNGQFDVRSPPVQIPDIPEEEQRPEIPSIQISPPSIPSSRGSLGFPTTIDSIRISPPSIPSSRGSLEEEILQVPSEELLSIDSSAEDPQYDLTPPRTPRPPMSDSDLEWDSDSDFSLPQSDPPVEATRLLLPSSFTIRQTDAGTYFAHVECAADVALELISRNYDSCLLYTSPSPRDS